MLNRFGNALLGTYSFLTGREGEQTLSELLTRVDPDKDLLVIDLETTGKNPIIDDILLIALTFDGQHAYVLDAKCMDVAPLIKLLEKIRVANQNIAFDYAFLRAKYDIKLNIAWDTYIAHALATAGLSREFGGNSLEYLAAKYLGIQLNKMVTKTFLTENWKNDQAISYAADDVLSTWALIPVTRSILRASGMWHIWETIELPFIEVIVKMQLAGIDFDLDKARDLRDMYIQKMEETLKKIREMVGPIEERVEVACGKCRKGQRFKKDGGGPCPFCNGTGKRIEVRTVELNPSSSKQLIEYFKSQGIPIPKKERADNRATESMDKASRKLIKHPLIPLLDEYAEYQKTVTGFLVPLTTSTLESKDGKYNHITGRIHTQYTQVDTATGRLSSRDPNLQNQKRDADIRSMFIAPKGQVLVTCDFSQYEVRVLAELSQDPGLISIFAKRAEYMEEMEEQLRKLGLVTYDESVGEKYPHLKTLQDNIDRYDFHNQTAIAIFKLDPDKIDYSSHQWKTLRSTAKSISFAIPYGAGPRRVADVAGISERDASARLNDYFRLYPKVKIWLDNIRASILKSDQTNLAARLGFPGRSISWTSTIYGRRRFFMLPDVHDPLEKRRILESMGRQACNFPIQGVNADVIKIAMIDLDNILQKDFPGAAIRLTVHDEIVTSSPKEYSYDLAWRQVQTMKDASNRFLKHVPTEVSISVAECWSK
jgi:DNA polymerase-1